MKPSNIVIHHSLTKDNLTVSWDAIRNYHINVEKWFDIGYHYGIENVNGHYEIFKGRMDNVCGAHCKGFNDKSIGICVVGNFDQEAPNASQMALLKRLVISLMDIYGIKKENVLGHWETYGLLNKIVEKSCPGIKFHMPDFRDSLK